MPKAYPKIVLKPKREKSLLQMHPWLFSGAIAKWPQVEPGSIVDVVDSQERFLGRGYLNPKSQIAVRLLSFSAKQDIDADFWQQRLQAALQRRQQLPSLTACNAVRLVFSEADELPGLVVDRYADYLVVQLLTLGMARQSEAIYATLKQLLPQHHIILRQDNKAEAWEGLPPPAANHDIPAEIVVEENGVRFLVNLQDSQKTGLYLDQRANRLLLRPYFKQKTVLDCFSYSGGFSLNAALAGASQVEAIDSSLSALQTLERNWSENKLSGEPQLHHGNAFEVLRQLQQQGKRFDCIILDPPKLAQQKKDLQSACRGYKDINLLAFKLLKADGILATFSCSGLVDATLFKQVVFAAALDSKTPAQIITHLQQDVDHPVHLFAPEANYLKGLLIKKMG